MRALIGIVDPPRQEARAAIDEAVGEALNLDESGEQVVAVTGQDLDAMAEELRKAVRRSRTGELAT